MVLVYCKRKREDSVREWKEKGRKHRECKFEQLR